VIFFLRLTSNQQPATSDQHLLNQSKMNIFLIGAD
jgi:hypothetical protein